MRNLTFDLRRCPSKQAGPGADVGRAAVRGVWSGGTRVYIGAPTAALRRDGKGEGDSEVEGGGDWQWRG
jgi:hypothetical protein